MFYIGRIPFPARNDVFRLDRAIFSDHIEPAAALAGLIIKTAGLRAAEVNGFADDRRLTSFGSFSRMGRRDRLF
jgi:hypothetical protein